MTQARNVWSIVYVNALVLRDQSSQHNGTLDQRLYVQQDANWNVTALVDSSGTVLERYDYTPYGAVTVLNPDFSVRGSSAYAMPYLWQGERYDASTGLYHVGIRDESPLLMRPLQTDPLGHATGPNPYLWEGNGPTDAADPSGLDYFKNGEWYDYFLLPAIWRLDVAYYRGKKLDAQTNVNRHQNYNPDETDRPE